MATAGPPSFFLPLRSPLQVQPGCKSRTLFSCPESWRPGGSTLRGPRASKARAGQTSHSFARRFSPHLFWSSWTSQPLGPEFPEHPAHQEWKLPSPRASPGGAHQTSHPPGGSWGPSRRLYLRPSVGLVSPSPPKRHAPGEWPRGADHQARGSARALGHYRMQAAPALLLTQGVDFYFYLGRLQPSLPPAVPPPLSNCRSLA